MIIFMVKWWSFVICFYSNSQWWLSYHRYKRTSRTWSSRWHDRGLWVRCPWNILACIFCCFVLFILFFLGIIVVRVRVVLGRNVSEEGNARCFGKVRGLLVLACLLFSLFFWSSLVLVGRDCPLFVGQICYHFHYRLFSW